MFVLTKKKKKLISRLVECVGSGDTTVAIARNLSSVPDMVETGLEDLHIVVRWQEKYWANTSVTGRGDTNSCQGERTYAAVAQEAHWRRGSARTKSG